MYEHMFVPIQNPRLKAQHEKARQLRHLGLSINRIAREVGVAKSTVSLWVRDIQVKPGEIERARRSSTARRNAKWSALCRQRRRRFQEEGRIRARAGEPLHIAGCMLYWAEGSKNRNVVKFSNSDPAMVAFFAKFLREGFSLTSDDMSFNLNVYTGNGLTIGEIEAYWREFLGLGPSCVRKHILNHFSTSSSGSRRRKLPYGVCNLAVKRSTWLIQHIYGAVQEYSGVDRPDWLDGPPRTPKV